LQAHKDKKIEKRMQKSTKRMNPAILELYKKILNEEIDKL
jgi:hypothetical protein